MRISLGGEPQTQGGPTSGAERSSNGSSAPPTKGRTLAHRPRDGLRSRRLQVIINEVTEDCEFLVSTARDEDIAVMVATPSRPAGPLNWRSVSITKKKRVVVFDRATTRPNSALERFAPPQMHDVSSTMTASRRSHGLEHPARSGDCENATGARDRRPCTLRRDGRSFILIQRAGHAFLRHCLSRVSGFRPASS